MTATNENLEKVDASLLEAEEDVSSFDEYNELPKSPSQPPPQAHEESARPTTSPPRHAAPPPPAQREMHPEINTQLAPAKKPVANTRTAPRAPDLVSYSKDIATPVKAKEEPILKSHIQPQPRVTHNRTKSLDTAAASSPSNNKNSLSESHELVKKVKLTKLLGDHENFGKDLISIRIALTKIAKAQKAYKEKITHVIEKHASNLTLGKDDKLLSTFSVLLRLVEVTADQHLNVAKYLSGTVEPQLQKLQANDKHHLQTARTKFRNSERKVQHAKGHAKQCKQKYNEELKLCQKMSDPDWKPPEPKGLFKSLNLGKAEKVLPQTLVGEQYETLQRSEEAYKTSVWEANEIQDGHVRLCEDLKNECLLNQMSRYSKSIRHLDELKTKCGDMTEGSKCINAQHKYEAHLENLATDELLVNQYTRLVNKYDEDKPPLKVKFETTGWKNIFVSVEEAMVPEKNKHIPLVMDVLCTKIKELKGFKTDGIFRKSADQHEKHRIRRQLLEGNYNINADSPHIPACVLKDWLRNLKEPLIPNMHYNICIDMARNRSLSAEAFEVFLSQIPIAKRNTIKYLVKFLRELCTEENKKITMMDIRNVAIIFGPNLLRCTDPDPQIMLANSGHEREFCQKLIETLDITRDTWLNETNTTQQNDHYEN